MLVVGAARSGTTALVTELATHPALYAGAPKEPHFLALGERGPLAFTGPGDDVTINAKSVLDPAAWAAMYPSPGGIDGSVLTTKSMRRSWPGSMSPMVQMSERRPKFSK